MVKHKLKLELALPEKSVFIPRVFAPEEQDVYSPALLSYPAPLGAECKVKRQKNIALRWSAELFRDARL